MKNTGFTNSIRKKLIVKAHKRNLRIKEFPRIQKEYNIGIVVNKEDADLIVLSQLFKNSKVEFFIFNKNERPKDELDDDVYSSDLNFIGIPTKKRTIPFVKTSFDLLINISTDLNLPAEYISAKSVAKFKIGFSAESDIYDLILNLPKNKFRYLFEELEKIITNFNT